MVIGGGVVVGDAVVVGDGVVVGDPVVVGAVLACGGVVLGGGWTLVVVVHTVCDIDPREAVNMPVLLAVEWTQAGPHSVRLNDVASKNIEFMLVTADTSQ